MKRKKEKIHTLWMWCGCIWDADAVGMQMRLGCGCGWDADAVDIDE